MIRIILCEGRSDAILLSLYLNKTCNWKYSKESKVGIKVKETYPLGDEIVNCYTKDGEELLICSVGGRDRFGYFLNEYIYKVIYYSSNDVRYRIALIIDADDRSEEDIVVDVKKQLSFGINEMCNDKWLINSINDSFGNEVTIDFLLTILPKDKEGALEDVLMDSLSEMDDGQYIIGESKKFIDIMKQNVYLTKNRLKTKAKLGVALSVFYPDKVFDQFDKQLKLVDWSKSESLKICFKELIKI